MRLVWLPLLVPVAALAQQPVAPSLDRQARSREIGAYSVSNLLETGYRFAEIGGDHDLYRAGVNYGNGLRLLQGRLRATSLDRDGLLDEFSLLSTGGLADPYRHHALRAQRNGVFRYDLQYRAIRYHNRLPTLWRGERGLRSSRTMQAHSIVLRPGAPFEVILGLDLNRRSGPGFASEAVPYGEGGFDARNFLRYRTDLEQRSRQYRAGFAARYFGMALTVIQAVELYEEGGEAADASHLPSAARNVQPVESLRRSEPFHGRTPVTTVALRSHENRRLGVAARFVHSGGYRNSTLMQDLAVPDPAASAATVRDTFIVGDASRSQGSGEITVSFLAGTRLALTNTTSFHNTRIDGQAALLETGLFRDEFVRFEHLGIRRLSNASAVTFRPGKPVSVFGAHRFSDRRVRAQQATRFPDFGFSSDLESQDNRVRSAAGGLRWLPSPGLRAAFDFETGRADRPFAATSERRFHSQSARVSWRRGGWAAGGFLRNRANDNPAELLAYSAQSRAFGAHASWVAREGGTVFDAAYSRLLMDVSTGILNLFDLADLPGRGRNSYASSMHVLSAGMQMAPMPRLNLAMRYSLTKDTAGGDSGFVRDGADLFSGLPLTYQSPQARISVRLRDGAWWNAGWQYYGYAERFAGTRGYRAHTGFSSLSLSF